MSEEVFTEQQNAIFNYLFHLDVNSNTEKKKSGGTTLTYLSWAWAWARVKEKFPTAEYKIERFEGGKPYLYDPLTGYMVFTKVTIANMTYEMWLPVMDGSNKAMKAEPYTYDTKTRKGIVVQSATMFDINKTLMRCFVKNLAMFGLGLYIYAGEDLPESEPATDEQKNEIRALIKEAAELSKRSEKTFEAQTLAKFQYAGKFNDIDVVLYGYLKDFLEDGISKLKSAKEE